eukprot:TRINITY_DN48709_c0_g1_i1.p1 TRINITY_DN48709_c0_g1~~TRINITY_DN48709_c0_g1_i1.p1  ORF type:complete len:243 (+),score=44.15 TRINITY_DN48709_c0_g1_i1:55-783(+)
MMASMFPFCCCWEAGGDKSSVNQPVSSVPSLQERTTYEFTCGDSLGNTLQASDLLSAIHGVGGADMLEPPMMFEMHMQKELSLGLLFDTTHDDFLVIKEIHQGLVQEWNETCSPDKVVRIHDRIKEVNGESGLCKDLLQKVGPADNSHLSLTIQRPTEREVSLRSPGKIGAKLNYKKVSRCLVITGIEEGLLRQWNVRHPSVEVVPSDRIVAVNGMGGEALELMKLMRESSAFILTVLHYDN